MLIYQRNDEPNILTGRARTGTGGRVSVAQVVGTGLYRPRTQLPGVTVKFKYLLVVAAM